jgi:uncharacterized protein YjhX (UPF0386 family)
MAILHLLAQAFSIQKKNDKSRDFTETKRLKPYGKVGTKVQIRRMGKSRAKYFDKSNSRPYQPNKRGYQFSKMVLSLDISSHLRHLLLV